MDSRRKFVQRLAVGTTSLATGLTTSSPSTAQSAPQVGPPVEGEDLFSYLRRQNGSVDTKRYCELLGAANDFKEGDEIIGVAAADEASRAHARALLGQTRIDDIDAHPPYRDALLSLIESGRSKKGDESESVEHWTLSELKQFLLTAPEDSIKNVARTLSSDVIGCVVKLMSNEELIHVGANVFNPLPNSQIGARGYLGARIQPNSPTDHPDDIRWQVFDAFAYAVGDVLVGTNPVSSEVNSVMEIERTLQEILRTFEIDNFLPHCVLSHIDVQAEVERQEPGSTELWFQSIGGTVGSNRTFDLTLEKMKQYAARRTGRFGLYFETGQGADFTNGHGNGFDMVLHESRKYGFARALKQIVKDALPAQLASDAWVHLNDVAGFIGPEVFRTREQLVRCCLEDIVMGKLHGLCIGLDVCSTLHMDVSLDDLDWCLEQIAPANPAYLMALPTKIDPMLGYLTTGYQDHVRLRERFGFKVNDPMWKFFQELGVVDDRGQPTEHFGDPTWVYLQYRRKQGDRRADESILNSARQQMDEVRSRGLFLAEGYGRTPSTLEPRLAQQIQRIYEDGKQSIWAELTPEFLLQVPDQFRIATLSTDREDYILHPESGEQIAEGSVKQLATLKRSRTADEDVQIVISDGLNAHSIMDPGHLQPFLDRLRVQLTKAGYRPALENILITSGRVRAGYRIGEALFGDAPGMRSVLHLIGERPGTGHHTFSVYITSTTGQIWAEPGRVDHDITKVVSGIANTALPPHDGADRTVLLLKSLR